MRSATGQVARPIFFATLIIISAYFPLFTLQRGEAALFTPMAFTVGYALFGALLCTLGIIPGLAYLAFRKPRPTFQNKPLIWLTRGYRAALGGLLNRPILSYLAAGVAFVAVGVLGRRSAGTICPISTRARSGCRSNCRAACRSKPRAAWQASCGAPCANSRKSTS